VGRIQSMQWQVPVPHPQILQAFGAIDSSYPERIMHMAEQAAEHQRFMEREAMRQQDAELQSGRTLRGRGQWFAGGLAVFFGLVGAYMASIGHATAGASIITGTVVSLAAVFLIGRSTANGRD